MDKKPKQNKGKKSNRAEHYKLGFAHTMPNMLTARSAPFILEALKRGNFCRTNYLVFPILKIL
ncbi:MAG: hypothetical protein A2534_00105 [Candidatus Magasanikbacteria bacterium RIFOXYD2_FULL_39_9]|uniref:Uncharacterized protein n=1 Tax=Candidatus Magasanikbacteria bacterium RIFOXYD1_FULL_40_23 TaxID=1798705 RepID=A0A1F6P949_9BACT|nr:MAG: hypothetical protein A2563_03005 [Candidatus Magasanikbacteria bacterium RIFOXYD1_FULL_40_23]OGH93550.1 MAG: hypothetical protein A2534_00105 [Candidatus Magasanikbacteria bacterium RIFOXYD2_FULL_39_9]